MAYASNVVGKGPSSAPFPYTTAGILPSAPTITAVAEVAGALTVTLSPPVSAGTSRTWLLGRRAWVPVCLCVLGPGALWMWPLHVQQLTRRLPNQLPPSLQPSQTTLWWLPRWAAAAPSPSLLWAPWSAAR